MAQCKKCNQYVSKKKSDVIQCKGSCQAYYHKSCVQEYKSFLEKEMCDNCADGSNNAGGFKITADGNTSMEAILLQINDKLNIVYSLKEKMDELTNVVEFYAEKYQELEQFKKEYTEKVKLQENKIVALNNQNVYLEKYSKALEERVCVLEQKELDKNIEIVNVQDEQNENTMEVVSKIAKELKLNTSDIQKAWRVGVKTRDSKKRPIVVMLRSREARSAWLQCRKQRIMNSKVFNNENNYPIYINENITKYIRQLFWETKTKLKETYKYIWIQNAKILIKRNDESKKIIQIRTQSDIDTYINYSE